MSRLFLIVTLSLLSAGTLVSQPNASAETPLTRATVQALRNQVQLIFKNRVTRAAHSADTMTPGDSLATARRSFAELRFNDSSLARIGERALFQFVPSTRNFYLGNGTALLLIPPGQGRTHIRTPNAAAGIRGSALFVRYNEDTNTTIVGALTNSQIEVSNGQSPQAQTLKAGQMAVIIQNQIVQVYNFDLNTFYQTSELVKGLDLPLRNASPSTDPGIAAVQAETAQAAKEQTPLTGQVAENPAFVSLSPVPGLRTAVTPGSVNQITLTPSGFDLSTARQTLIANPSAQAFTAPVAGVQPDTTPQIQLSVPNPASASAIAPQVKPIILPQLPDPRVVTGVVPAVSTTPPLSTPPLSTPPLSTPSPPTPSAIVPATQVTPSPTPAAPIPGSTPPSPPTPSAIVPAAQVTPPSTPPAPIPDSTLQPPILDYGTPTTATPSLTVQPSTQTPVLPVTQSPAPTVQPSTPITPSPAVTVQPSTPVPAIAVQPSTPVPSVTVPQPSPALAPTVTPISNPAPRPDPVATPAVTSVVQPAPTPISPAADTSAVRTTIVTPPAVVTPASTTVQVQTGTSGTSVQVQPGATGVTVTPLSN